MLACVSRTALALAFTLALASRAGAGTFDLIWGNRITVTTYPTNSGFNIYGRDIAIVVNTGSTDITGPEFRGATLTGTSTTPGIEVFLYIDPNVPIVPVHPNEATGSVVDFNAVLLTLLEPGETFHQTSPLLSLEVSYPPGFSGSAQLVLAIAMEGDIAQFSIQMTFVAGTDFAIQFDSAGRTSAVPLPTAARQTSWGRLKKLYR